MKNRHLLSLVVFSGIVLSALIAIAMFRDQKPEGFLWLGASGILLTWTGSASIPALISSPGLNLASGKRCYIAAGLLIVGGLFLVDSARLFAIQLRETLYTTDAPWTPFAVGLTLWITGSWLLTYDAQPARLKRVSLLLLLILSVAVFLRVYHLETTPTGIWYDEAANGLEARHILHNLDYRPVFVINMGFPHLALYAVLLGLFGETNIMAMRLLAAAFAVASVFMGYVVGCQIRGHVFGLLMALILATLRWSINFSRTAMNGVEVIFFIFAALYFFIRLVQYGQMRDAVRAGLTIGIALWFYRAFQVMLVAYGLFLLITWKYRPWKRTLALGLTVGLNALVVIFPLLIFALTRPEYIDRVQTVSIFNSSNRDAPLADTLVANLSSHLAMFHLNGDPNGRHNLPGAPMLDPVTGILFGLGLVVSLRHLRSPFTIFFGAVLVLGLSGGILSLPFEAPQSLRSIGVLPAVAYFSALGGLALGQALWQQIHLLPSLTSMTNHAVPTAAVFGLGLALTALNFDTYFNKQQTDYRVWSQYSTYETLVGRVLAAQSEDTALYISPFLFRHVSSLFLAEDQTNRAEMMKMPDVLPVRLPPEQKVLMIFTPRERMLYEYARHLYPNGTFHPVTSRDYGIKPPEQEPELFYVVELEPDDIAGLQGLAADGSGIFYAPDYAMYRFAVPEDGTVTLNGERFTDGGFTIQLPQGNNQISVEPPNMQLSWWKDSQLEAVPRWLLYHAPVEFEGVRAAFYANGDWEGTPVTIETHPFIYQYIQILPMQRPYSVIYSGQLYIPDPGDYTFYLTAIDYARLSIDGALVVETAEPNQRIAQSLSLTSGWHNLEVRRQDLTGSTFVFLEWTPPGSDHREPIPMDRFRPIDVNGGASDR